MARVETALPALPTPRRHPNIEYVSESLIRRYHELASSGRTLIPRPVDEP